MTSYIYAAPLNFPWGLPPMSKPPHSLQHKENKWKKGNGFLHILQHKKVLVDVVRGNYIRHCRFPEVGDSPFSRREIGVFWVETPRNLEDRYKRFEVTYCFHLQGWKIVNQERNRHEDRANIFLQNIHSIISQKILNNCHYEIFILFHNTILPGSLVCNKL